MRSSRTVGSFAVVSVARCLLAVLACGGVAGVARMQAAAPPLLADWTFEEGTNGNPAVVLRDQSGNGNHSTVIFGSPSYEASQICPASPLPGLAMRCPPGNAGGFGSGFLVGERPSFNLTGNFTLEAVIRPQADGLGYGREIVGRDGGAGGPGIPYILGFDEATKEVGFTISTTGFRSFTVAAPFPMDGKSHHVAGVYSNFWLYLYLDGQLLASRLTTERPFTGNLPGISVGANTLGGFWFNGTIDRVRIANEALAPSQFVVAEETAIAAWLTSYFGPDFAANPDARVNADPDRDGSTNLEEYRANTHPMDATSGFKAAIRLVPSISWASIPGRDYRVKRKESASAQDWTTVVASVRATSNLTSVSDPDAPSTAVYIVELLPQP